MNFELLQLLCFDLQVTVIVFLTIIFCCLFVLAVLITAGYNGRGPPSRSAEIYNPLTKTSCSLPQLPVSRQQHTQDGDLACDGGGSSGATYTTCVKWSPVSGTWTKSHTLRQRRTGHVSWATASGVYLIGGTFSMRTSEKLKVDGSVEFGFGLKYDTRYTMHSSYIHINLYICTYILYNTPVQNSIQQRKSFQMRFS